MKGIGQPMEFSEAVLQICASLPCALKRRRNSMHIFQLPKKFTSNTQRKSSSSVLSPGLQPSADTGIIEQNIDMAEMGPRRLSAKAVIRLRLSVTSQAMPTTSTPWFKARISFAATLHRTPLGQYRQSPHGIFQPPNICRYQAGDDGHFVAPPLGSPQETLWANVRREIFHRAWGEAPSPIPQPPNASQVGAVSLATLRPAFIRAETERCRSG